jgi:hypothetical protein
MSVMGEAAFRQAQSLVVMAESRLVGVGREGAECRVSPGVLHFTCCLLLEALMAHGAGKTGYTICTTRFE